METCFNYCYFNREDREIAFFSSDERRWITRIRKLAKKYPDEVTILKEPEVNDGCIYARLPSSWLKVSPKKKVTDQQRLAAAERLQKTRENHKI